MGALGLSERTPVGHLFDAEFEDDPTAYLQIFERKGNTLHVHATDADRTIIATVSFQEPDQFSGVMAIVRNSPEKPIASGNRVIAIIKVDPKKNDTFIVLAANGSDRLGLIRPTEKPGYQFEAVSEGGETWYIRSAGYTYIPDGAESGDIYLAQKATHDAAGMGASFMASLSA